MLLPSAFSCADSSSDTSTSSSHFHLQRPKLQSFGAYQPRQSSSHHAVAATAVATRLNPLSSSCRALQAILGVPQSTTISNSNSSSLTLYEPPSDPFMLPDHSPHPSGPVRQRPPSPPRRTAVKRRRSEFERDYVGRSDQGQHQDQLSSDIHMDDYSPSPRQHQRTNSSPAAVMMMRTPKRRRRIPLSMPLGLCADDFRGLETPPEEIEMPPTTNVMMTMNTASPCSPCHHDQIHLLSTHQSQTTLCGRSIGGYSDRDRGRDPDRDSDSAYASGSCSASCSVSSSSGSSGSGSSPLETKEESEEWTLEDDRMLVETVLEKLKLTKRDWNDCARRLGRDKDSLGRRWSLLVDRGNVGLRRGSGRRSRTDLDISSW
ncbi:hypothetical protein ABEF93_001783 [Exophiala dermatitidis]